MGNLNLLDLDEIINVFLKNFLKIDVLYYEKIESGGEGYVAIHMSDLNQEQEYVLSKIGFEKVKSDLWVLEGFDIDPLNLKDILKPYSEYLEKELWKKAIYKRYELDETYRTKYRNTLFETHYLIPKLAIKWYEKICVGEHIFNDFIQDLNKIFRESLNYDFIEKIREKKDFLKIVGALRNRISHSSIKPKELHTPIRYIESKMDSNSQKCWYDHVNLQISLIEDTIEFPEEINSEEGLS